jgi:hypothetical protein
MKPITHATDNEDEEAKATNDVAEHEETNDEPVTTRSRGLLLCSLAVGMLLVVIFLASFVVQFNDSGAVATWALFYLLHALLAGVGIVRHWWCRVFLPPKILLGVTAALAIWSIVLMGISGASLADTASGGQEAGGDNPNATSREEKAYEFGGAFIGFASAVFHAILFGGYFCFKNL